MPDPSTHVRILTVPGLGNSGPKHWQTRWEETRTDTLRVELGQWDRPHRNSWIGKLDQAIHASRLPTVLVAHSLGCVAVAWWAAFAGRLPGNRVTGALLVAPADCDDPATDPRIMPFAPIPVRRLPFPSVLVASRDDPWLRFERAEELATRWGSRLVDAGHAGHINADSRLDDWRAGQALLSTLLPATEPAQQRAGAIRGSEPPKPALPL